MEAARALRYGERENQVGSVTRLTGFKAKKLRYRKGAVEMKRRETLGSFMNRSAAWRLQVYLNATQNPGNERQIGIMGKSFGGCKQCQAVSI